MTTPVPETWSEAYCEQCGARADLSAASREGRRGGWRAAPLRTCPECGLLTCRSCWHPRSTRCRDCFTQRLAGAHPVAQEEAGARGDADAAEPAAPDSPTLPAPSDPLTTRREPVALPRPHRAGTAPGPGPRPRWVAAAAAALVLVTVGAAGFLVLPGSPRGDGAVAGITARPTPSDGTRTTAGGPDVNAGPKAVASPRPAGAAPAHVDLVDAVVTSWVDDLGEVRAHVVATVENRGGTPARLPGTESTFSIVDETGSTVAGGLFGHAFPPIVQPGERAYLIDTLSATFADRDEISDVTVDVAFEPTTHAIKAVEVSNIEWDAGADGLVVSGEVRNPGEDEIASVAIAVVLLDARSRVLGAVYDVTDVQGLQPGARAQFETAYPGLPPIEPAEIAEPVVVAFEQG